MPSKYDLTQTERLLYTTTRLETWAKGTPLQVGTGFFYWFKLADNTRCVLLVTNKHVLVGADTVKFAMHLGGSKAKGPSGELLQIELPLPGLVLAHPEESVDLCALLVSETINKLLNKGLMPHFVCLERSMIPEGEEWYNFDGIEELVMIGCPSGIYDSKHNLPITRRGITATSVVNDYEGRREFVVDLACFPGSSGSPIFVMNDIGYLDRAQNTFMMGAARIKLVGVLFAGPLVSANGHVQLASPGQVSVQTMMHLGYALKADRIPELEELVRRDWNGQPP